MAVTKTQNTQEPEKPTLNPELQTSQDIVEQTLNKQEAIPAPVDQPERALETVAEEEKKTIEEHENVKKELEAHKEEIGSITSAQTLQVSQAQKDPVQLEVEGVLQQELEDDYKSMTPDEQVEFKRMGEETASKISLLLKSAKVQFEKILELIKTWLKLIPNVNKYYLEQQSKIKTDELKKMKEEGLFDNK
ncbi:hypothetical protein A2478_04685 [Candidatus Falkowbacteria bacterium RIFOXYC2_FULL_36_12]|uniref:Uncharacterized protein n=1 Tax=Candidatus Falkowbacteria bacterium RIFOXYC2_FULL_36_12 TaxID=1798002 RepID=A0A1F5SYG5_9BACT|nr:MAG: hypothetical protein A2478_04685 [Candidatus Falkowbacteria bacterium RIFOXYC2_FULL_36_12]